MVYRIFFELKDGTQDSIDISGGCLEEIREIVEYQMKMRVAKPLWSERVE